MVKNPDSPYYKLLLNRDNLWCVACLQWFDEYDYDQSRYKFENEDDARIWLNKKFPIEKIDEEDRIYMA